jgi:hypothetical protein
MLKAVTADLGGLKMLKISTASPPRLLSVLPARTVVGGSLNT